MNTLLSAVVPLRVSSVHSIHSSRGASLMLASHLERQVYSCRKAIKACFSAGNLLTNLQSAFPLPSTLSPIIMSLVITPLVGGTKGTGFNDVEKLMKDGECSVCAS
jgi:hypothetical protein